MMEHNPVVVTEPTFVECVGFYRVIAPGETHDPCATCKIVSRADYLDAAVAEYGKALSEAQATLEQSYRRAGVLA